MGDTAVDIFLESLKQLITNSKLLSIKGEKHQLQSLEMEIKYLREFLKATEKIRNEHTEVMNLVMQIRDVVFESENTVELFVGYAYNQDHLSCWDKFFEWLSLGKLFHWDRLCELFLCRLPCNDQNHLSLDLECVKKEIKTLMDKVKQIYDKNVYDINRIAVKKLEHSFTGSSGGSLRGSSTSKVGEEKVVVGFEKEMHKLMGQLHNSRKGGRLEIISIIGAPGGGKTTLATEVYQYPFTSHAFDILAWVVVSQDYDKTKKRDMLISILQSASQEKYKDYVKISNENILGEKVHKCLKGRKYLIVMDDIWSIEAWNDIQRSFPRECKGSKVLFTSRQLVVQLDSDDYVHHLAPLQESHSWELLQKKIRRICLEVWNRMESKLVPFSRWVQNVGNGAAMTLIVNMIMERICTPFVLV